MSSSSTSTMAGRFSAQMSGQIPGWPAAIRVMSRNPPAARRNTAACSLARPAAICMSVAAVRCGTCDTIATMRSWTSGESVTTSAPRDATTECTNACAVGSVPAEGVSTHTARSNMSARDPSMPSCSLPAIGCPPTKRGWSIAFATAALTPATSVTTARLVASCSEATAVTMPGGTATKQISASGSRPSASIAPSARARVSVAGSRSAPADVPPLRS